MISVRNFGKTPDGKDTQLFILENGSASAYITDYGAHIVSLNVPDKNGILTDVVLGFDNVEPYTGDIGYMGATIGRFANRIESGRFNLKGITYNVAVNNGPNHLHGGIEGFNHKVFDAYVDGDSLTLSYTSPDMEEGYPGTLKFSVTFNLTKDNCLEISYKAESDKDTIVNFTNHSYFNLNGAISEKSIYNHNLMINAQAFCDGDENCLATGAIIPVRGTDMDFRDGAMLGERLASEYPAIKNTGGIDHNFVLSMQRGEMKTAAKLFCEDTGIGVECLTDQPGIQVYTANFTDYDGGKGGAKYSKHSAVCLETQTFPNSTSFSYFPSPVLKAGDVFESKTVYRFTVK